MVSASDDQTIRIWNWQSRTCISVLTGAQPSHCLFRIPHMASEHANDNAHRIVTLTQGTYAYPVLDTFTGLH